jgi:uncharacterized protein (TIGR02271 family)
MIVRGRDGLRGALDPTPVQDRWMALTLDDGRRVWIDSNALIAQPDGTYFVDLGPLDVATATNGNESIVVPVIQEFAAVQKRVVEGPGVRVTKRVRERVETVSVPLQREEIHVERVAAQQISTTLPEPRTEGATYIIPVVEEVLVVEKRFFVREEVRITRTMVTEQSAPQNITLRGEELEIERIEPARPSTH